MIHLASLFSATRLRAPRGFTLLVALIFTSVVLAVGLALLDITYKQVILSSTARQSEYAFYAADSAMECALYADNKLDDFDYGSEPVSNTDAGSITCEGQSNILYTGGVASGNTRLSSFTIPCAGSGGGTLAQVYVYKQITGQTTIFADGFNTCNTTDPQRIERGLESSD
jgi:Tfp pilus assembly protein PilX